MSDVVVVGLCLSLVLGSWGLIALCERLQGGGR